MSQKAESAKVQTHFQRSSMCGRIGEALTSATGIGFSILAEKAIGIVMKEVCECPLRGDYASVDSEILAACIAAGEKRKNTT